MLKTKFLNYSLFVLFLFALNIIPFAMEVGFVKIHPIKANIAYANEVESNKSPDEINKIKAKNILYLSEFNASNNFDMEIIKKINVKFKNSDIPINYYEEFLNLPVSSASEDYFKLLVQILADKYKNIKFDFIIAHGCVDFLKMYASMLFPDTPIIFCALDEKSYNLLTNDLNFSATVEVIRPEVVLDFILFNFKKINNIVVVYDKTSRSRNLLSELYNLERKYPNIKFSYLEFHNKIQISNIINELPAQTAILDIGYFSAPSSDYYFHGNKQSLELIDIKAPLFTVWNDSVGFGSIAGQYISPTLHANALNEIIDSYLKNNFSPMLIKVEEAKLQLDNDLLQVYGLGNTSIPIFSSIVNGPISFYQKYQNTILITAIVINISLLLILILLLILRQSSLEKSILISKVKEQKSKKKAQKQKQHTAKMSSLAAFSCGIAHDVNGILNTISLCTELIKNEIMDFKEKDSEIKAVKSYISKDINKIEEVISHGKNIIKKINVNSYLTKERPIETLLDKEIKSSICLMEKTLSPNCKLNYHNFVPKALISLSSEEIYQVLNNLCINAVQAMQDGQGSISIDIKQDKVKKVLITVHDTGNGIHHKDLKRIFDPYFSTKKHQGNFGLGPFSVHSIIMAHKGQITVTSSQYNGTCFKIVLPTI